MTSEEPAVALAPMAKWYWGGMDGVYPDGRRYDLAFASARSAAAVEGTAERWETLETSPFIRFVSLKNVTPIGMRRRFSTRGFLRGIFA